MAGLLVAGSSVAPGSSGELAAHEEYVYRISFSRDGALMAALVPLARRRR